MLLLAIETSCDETGIALIQADGGLRAPKFKVLQNAVSSQIPLHRPFGGVVPNLAKREHLKALPLLYAQVMGEGANAARLWKKIDAITVTVGPGLEPALWTGIEFAKQLAQTQKKPLIAANHLEGHLYSFLLPAAAPKSSASRAPKIIFPAVALIVSGGHTILLRMESFSKWKRLGETRDDAAGEAFDKVARLLELPYPGGPEIEKLARTGNPAAIAFPRPMMREKNWDFSFSGLKTAVLYYCREHPRADKADVAASFQAAAIEVLVRKTIRAAETCGARSVILCGGVAANKALRSRLKRDAAAHDAALFVPEFKYNLDNAAMIGVAGWFAHMRKKHYPLVADGGMEI